MSAPAIFPVGPKWIRTNLPWNTDAKINISVSSMVVKQCHFVSVKNSVLVKSYEVLIFYLKKKKKKKSSFRFVDLKKATLKWYINATFIRFRSLRLWAE